jgi:UDP-N-acetylmuramate dehydrogenase
MGGRGRNLNEKEGRASVVDWGIRGTVMRDVPMKRYTSMKVGGPVRYLAYPADEADLLCLLATLKEKGIAHRLVGNGTNIIVHDRGLGEAVIRLTKIRNLRYRRVEGGAKVEVSGGVSLKGLIRENAHRGLSGMEKLFWIPGTVGGAVKMNAGSFGSSIADTLDEVRVVDGKGHVLARKKADMAFGYRTSPIGSAQCVAGATFSLTDRDKGEILKDMEYVYTERKRRHPMELPSSGSVFKAVDGEPAWRLIEKAGLKGVKEGGAAVSEKHANFIVNLGYAKAEDIRRLIERIKTEVFEKLGVRLEEEVELWGFEGNS